MDFLRKVNLSLVLSRTSILYINRLTYVSFLYFYLTNVSITKGTYFMYVWGLLLLKQYESWTFLWFSFTHVRSLNILKSRDRFSSESWHIVPRCKMGESRGTLAEVGLSFLPIGQGSTHNAACYGNTVSGYMIGGCSYYRCQSNNRLTVGLTPDQELETQRQWTMVLLAVKLQSCVGLVGADMWMNDWGRPGKLRAAIRD